MFSGCLMIDCLRSYCMVKPRGFAHLGAPGPVSMMLLCMIVKLVKLVDRTEMRKTDCFGKTRLVLHVSSSSWAGKRYNNDYYYEWDAHQHGSLGNITGLSLHFRYGLHVVTVRGHGGIRRRGVYRNHLDALVLEELHQSCPRVNSNHKLSIAVTNRNQRQTCSKVNCTREEPLDKCVVNGRRWGKRNMAQWRLCLRVLEMSSVLTVTAMPWFNCAFGESKRWMGQCEADKAHRAISWIIENMS